MIVTPSMARNSLEGNQENYYVFSIKCMQRENNLIVEEPKNTWVFFYYSLVDASGTLLTRQSHRVRV